MVWLLRAGESTARATNETCAARGQQTATPSTSAPRSKLLPCTPLQHPAKTKHERPKSADAAQPRLVSWREGARAGERSATLSLGVARQALRRSRVGPLLRLRPLDGDRDHRALQPRRRHAEHHAVAAADAGDEQVAADERPLAVVARLTRLKGKRGRGRTSVARGGHHRALHALRPHIAPRFCRVAPGGPGCPASP